MSPMEQLAKQEYERGYSDGKSDYFAAGVAEGEMRARQRMIANRVVANQHPFAASDKPIADTVKTYEQGYLDGYDAGLIFANSRVEPVKQEPVAILKSSKANFERQFGKQVFADWVYDDLTYSFESAAPVSAEAIRAEALEEAAKVCEKAMIQMNYSEAPYKQCAAAIRGLK